MTLHRLNRRRLKAHGIQARKDANAFDLRQMSRVAAMRKRANTGFVRRWRKRMKEVRVAEIVALLPYAEPRYIEPPCVIGNQAGYYP